MRLRVVRPLVGVVVASVLLLASEAVGRQLPDDPGEPRLLVSRQLSEAAGLGRDDVVELSGHPDGTPRRFRIAGVYEPMPDPLRFTSPRHEVRLHLPDLIELTGDPADPLAAESVDAIGVALHDPRGASAFARAVAARVPGVVAHPTGATEGAGVFVVLERFHRAIALITVVASTIFLLTLMTMLVEERREVAGILRLIGVARGRILLQVLVEGFVVAVAGTLVGLLLAWASQGPLNLFFQWRYDTSLVFVRITPAILLHTASIAVPLGTFGCVVASWTILRRGMLGLAKR